MEHLKSQVEEGDVTLQLQQAQNLELAERLVSAWVGGLHGGEARAHGRQLNEVSVSRRGVAAAQAHMNEFVQWQAQAPQNAKVSHGTWLKRRQQGTLGPAAAASGGSQVSAARGNSSGAPQQQQQQGQGNGAPA